MIEQVAVKGTPDATKRRCYDCRSLQASVSWWCTNEAARKWRGALPGICDCPHWEPMRAASDLSLVERVFGDHLPVEINQ